jgi:predicted PurR-regulated permease PerM
MPELDSAPVAPSTRKGRRIALGILLALSFLTVAYIASSLWVGLMLGTVMAFSAQPMYRWLTVRFGERRWLAAALTTFVGGLITASGALLAGYILTREFLLLVALLQKKLANPSLNALIGERGAALIASFGIDRAELMHRLQMMLGRASTYFADAAGVILQATTSALLTFIIALWTMYYVLLEWPHIAIRLERLLPLDPRHTRALTQEFREVGRSAFIGTVATAAVQGVLAGVGYLIAGVPHSVTWGLMTAIGSFVPVVGTALVWGPVAAYLLIAGQPLWAVFVVVWGLLVVMAVADYVVRPRLAGKTGQAQPLLMLVALLGGIEVFGLAGLIVGPVLLSLFLAIARIYEREVSSVASGSPEKPD